MNIKWERGVLGTWRHMFDTGRVTSYLIDFHHGKVTVEYNTTARYEVIAAFDTEEEAKAYAEVCYRMGVHR